MVFGILGAMREEVASLIQHMSSRQATEVASRRFVRGDLFGKPVVVVESRWGKVAAATTATHLISTFHVDALLFTGVAGGVEPSANIGDIVVARGLYQHDLNAAPIFPPMEIPLLGVTSIQADEGLSSKLAKSAQLFIDNDLPTSVDDDVRAAFHMVKPKLFRGDVATGDQFFTDQHAVAALRNRVPSAVCVEMEGAAVAQVALEHGLPFAVVRTISDTADHAAPVDFPRFLARVAGVYAVGVLRRFLGG